MNFEIWRKEATVGDDKFMWSGYEWMVWEVGPITGAEEWFETEDEARAYITAKLERQEAA